MSSVWKSLAARTRRIRRARGGGIAERVANLQRFVSYEEQRAREPTQPVDLNTLRICWIIPDFLAGMGGHMTIFRIASLLEDFGHQVDLIVQNPSHHATEASVLSDINTHFRPFRGRVILASGEPPELEGDALIATDRFTCYMARAMTGFRRKFYFVQDLENLFYPAGAESIFVSNTYRFGFEIVCAGDWLADVLRNEYGRSATVWQLAVDPELYFANPLTPRSLNRIAFYARHSTPRRAVELGLIALELLQRRGVDFEVDFFGESLGQISLPYPFVDHGLLSGDDLAELYRRSAVGMVFSATNHSLIPKEMMACGLPVVDLDLPQVRRIFSADVMEFAEPTVEGIADALQGLLGDAARRTALGEAGRAFVSQFSWNASAHSVEGAIVGALAAPTSAQNEQAAT